MESPTLPERTGQLVEAVLNQIPGFDQAAHQLIRDRPLECPFRIRRADFIASALHNPKVIGLIRACADPAVTYMIKSLER